MSNFLRTFAVLLFLSSLFASTQMSVAATTEMSSGQYYIQNGYIYGPKMSGQFYIQNNYIYGPKNGGKYYIQNGYIYGPKEDGLFYIQGGYIYGPDKEPPWMRD